MQRGTFGKFILRPPLFCSKKPRSPHEPFRVQVAGALDRLLQPVHQTRAFACSVSQRLRMCEGLFCVCAPRSQTCMVSPLDCKP